jgi:hypothetical protein
MLTSQVHIEHAGRIGDDVGRLGDRGLDIAIGHASLRRGELLAAQEQPRRGVCIAGEGLGIGDQPPVVREICRTFEFSHPYKVSRKSSAARCPKDTIIPTGASPFSDAVTRMTPDRSPESQVDAVVDSCNLGAIRMLHAFAPILRPRGRFLVVARRHADRRCVPRPDRHRRVPSVVHRHEPA